MILLTQEQLNSVKAFLTLQTNGNHSMVSVHRIGAKLIEKLDKEQKLILDKCNIAVGISEPGGSNGHTANGEGSQVGNQEVEQVSSAVDGEQRLYYPLLNQWLTKAEANSIQGSASKDGSSATEALG